jgi:hypothetical protein
MPRHLREYQGGVFRKQRTVSVLKNCLKLRFQNEYDFKLNAGKGSLVYNVVKTFCEAFNLWLNFTLKLI